MVSSGVYDFTYDNSDFLTEAFEQAQMDPKAITYEHIESALRALNLMFLSWANKGVKQWKVEKFTYTSATSPAYSTGTASMTLPSRIIRILTCVHRDSDGSDTPIYQISRQEYEEIGVKTQSGDRTDRIFLDRQRDAPIIYLWPVINNSNDSLVLTAFVRTQDAGELSDTPDIPPLWYDAAVQGLAARLAKKWNFGIYPVLKADANEAFNDAKAEDREQASTQIIASLGGRMGD